jgi:cardiolipin synthase
LEKKSYITFICILFAIRVTAQVNSDSVVAHRLQKEGIPVTRNNETRLFVSGADKFHHLFADIRRARRHIHLEYFNLRNDSIGNALLDLLTQKVSEGVEVRVMFDAFGNWSNNRPLTKKQFKLLQSKGINIVKFDPITFPYVNHAFYRDHRKIVVIDGQVAYTGGMNIADYYIHGLPKLGEWHDIHIRITGDAVRYLQGIFLTMWNRETDQHIGGPDYFAYTPTLPDSISETIAIVDRTPNETPRAISRAYTASIEAARHNIQIINPYFVPTSSIRKSIKAALKRGVEVEIMIPSVSDIPFTPDAAFHKVHKLMKKGAKIYLFNNGFHHAKVMTVDDAFCTVGTANLNSRSLRYDYETNAFIFDKEVTRQLSDLFEKDKLNSTLLTPEVWKKRSPWKKFVGWAANLFTPFL